MPCMLTWSRANVPCVLMCSGANSLACLRAHVPCVLTCQSALRTYLLTCQCAFRAHILFLACLRANLSCVISCLRVQTKTSFQWHVFLRFEIKLYMKSAQAGMSLETSTGKYLGFECNFRFLQIPYFERQVTICDWSTQPTVVIELPLQLGSRRSQNAVKHLK